MSRAPQQITSSLLQPPAPAHLGWAGLDQCLHARSGAATTQRLYASGPASGSAASALADRSPAAAGGIGGSIVPIADPVCSDFLGIAVLLGAAECWFTVARKLLATVNSQNKHSV